ncbi:MAG: serine/threonine-protein kinase [Nannocystaceae bacterium]
MDVREARAETEPAPRAHDPRTLGRGDLATPEPSLAFPDLDGDDDVARMEEVLARRLFPRRVAATTIGRYTILDRLGQGGMGVVYAAHDPELDRKVAIKLLRGEALGPGAEARLRREAQAMAKIAHANVVVVIEVGVHEGRTYVVMEHLSGVPLDRWHERGRSWRETLAVYIQAGRGLAAAHRGGVIHRDFKPHNALLIEGGVDDGRVKVLDFGLARAAGADLADAAAEDPSRGAFGARLTRTGVLVGTPAYMAPEQITGAEVSAASDQYSFAASLYEALYGQLSRTGGSMAALAQAALDGEIRPPPADAAVPAWVHRVVVRGLERDPARRFESMDALCEALTRDPAGRRRSVALTAIFSGIVGVGGWAIARQDAASPCEGPTFEASALRGEGAGAALERAFAEVDAAGGATTARRVDALLEETAGSWAAARRGACEAHRRGELSEGRLDLRMDCLDRQRSRFVALEGALVRADAAAVERAIEAALTLPRPALCDDDEALAAGVPPPELKEPVREARSKLAEAASIAGVGRFADAEAAASEQLTRAQSLGFAPLVAEAALALGTSALETARADDAERSLSLALHQGIEGRVDRTAAEAVIRRVFVRGAMAGDQAGAAADEALARAYAARFPADGALRWLADMNLGAVAYRRGDLPRARSLYQRALAVEEGPTALDRARTRVNLGILEYDALDYEAALAADRAAIAEASAVLGDDHPLVQQIATYEASALESLGQRAAARRRLEGVLAGEASDDPRRSVWPRLRLARLLNHQRRYDAARDQAEAALAAADPSDKLARIKAEAALADATVDPVEALARAGRVVKEAAADFGDQHPYTVTIRHDAAVGLLRRGLADAALPLARQALAAREAHDGPTHPLSAESRRLVAEVLLALGDPKAADEAASAAAEALALAPGDHALDRALAELARGRARTALGDPAAATGVLRRALTLAEPRLDADDPDLAAILAALARASIDAGHPEDAGEPLQRARAAYQALGEPFAAELAGVDALDALARRRPASP